MGELLRLNKGQVHLLEGQQERVMRAALQRAATSNAYMQQQIAQLALALRGACPCDAEGRMPVWIIVPAVCDEDKGVQITITSLPDNTFRVEFAKPEETNLALPFGGLVGPDGQPAKGDAK